MLAAIEEVMLKERPAWALIYGDTNSTLAGALAAAKLQIPIAHVEAGLRLFNTRIPEEINRVVADRVSTRWFAPTATAVENLAREGISGESVQLVGDVMYDAAIAFGKKAERESEIVEQLRLVSGGYVLATVHRAENTDDPRIIRSIFASLSDLSNEIPVIVPLHPRTAKVVADLNIGKELSSSLRLIDPVGLLDMIQLEKHSRLIVTDSGGVQKEAFFHRKICVTLRTETEWQELVALGCNVLVSPTSRERILAGVRHALDQPFPELVDSPYGRGDAGSRIARLMLVSETNQTGAARPRAEGA